MMMNARMVAVLAVSCLVAGPVGAATLNVGDPAPALTIDQWVQGAAVDLSKDASKRVHLVEFWATWCPPCKASVPKLNDLQNKYKDQLTIVSVTDPDSRGNTPDAIKKFVKERGTGLSYHVAIDKNGKTSAAWMEAAGAMGIPHAFLVGKDGNIVWQGSPLEPEMDEVIEKSIKGTYDVKAAKIEAEVNRRLEAISPAARMGKWDVVITGLKDILKLDPGNEIGLDTLLRVYVEQQRDVNTFRSWVGTHIDAHKADSKVLTQLALAISQNDALLTEGPDLALKAARGAYESSTPRKLDVTVVYAKVLSQIGALDKAIAVQSEAVALADGETKDAVQKLLEYYQRCKDLHATVN